MLIHPFCVCFVFAEHHTFITRSQMIYQICQILKCDYHIISAFDVMTATETTNELVITQFVYKGLTPLRIILGHWKHLICADENNEIVSHLAAWVLIKCIIRSSHGVRYCAMWRQGHHRSARYCHNDLRHCGSPSCSQHGYTIHRRTHSITRLHIKWMEV